jgi:predicted dehydrogenase
MNEPFRVGVVGCGIGKLHILAYQNLPEQFQIMAACDVNEAKAYATAATIRFFQTPIL